MSKQIYLRTPISYYGGKQKLAKTINGFIPEHNLYCEPFLGGAAIFFAKAPSNVEVINDTNRELINFYQVCKNRYHELSSLGEVTLHSRDLHDDAWIIYNKPHLHDEVRRAWAVWVLSTLSFAAGLDDSWGYDKSENTTSSKISNKREQFSEDLAIRLQRAQNECADALYIIKSRDTATSFFYCDPPYYNSNCGHYDGYSFDDFENLLKLLTTVKGEFLLSSYSSPVLKQYVKENGWRERDVAQGVSINSKGGYQKRKVEVVTAISFFADKKSPDY